MVPLLELSRLAEWVCCLWALSGAFVLGFRTLCWVWAVGDSILAGGRMAWLWCGLSVSRLGWVSVWRIWGRVGEGRVG